MAYKGLIFDFNGVLLWDTDLQTRSWGAFSEQLRGWALTDEELRVHVHGRNMIYTLAYLLGREVLADEADVLGEQKEVIYRRMCLAWDDGFQLSLGAIALLDALVEHEIPHTIATASGWGNVRFFIEHLELDRWFDVDRIVYDDGSRPGKPAPDSYLEAARHLGLLPEQCVVIEDSDSGIAAAHAAGIGYVIALGPSEDHARLRGLDGVEGVVVSLAEVDVGALFG